MRRNKCSIFDYDDPCDLTNEELWEDAREFFRDNGVENPNQDWRDYESGKRWCVEHEAAHARQIYLEILSRLPMLLRACGVERRQIVNALNHTAEAWAENNG